MELNYGLFTFQRDRRLAINGRPHINWALLYGDQLLAARAIEVLPVGGISPQRIREAFADDIDAFIAEMRSLHNGKQIYLHNAATGEDVASFMAKDAWIPGMVAGLPNYRWTWWLVPSSRPGHSMYIESLAKFGRLMAEYEMPANGWIAGLLPEDVLTTDREKWRAPSPWEIRHVVGEASFTGVTGVMAAGYVGVTPQNFRKYLAPETASTRQRMSYAMWHLLLHRLGVQTLAPYFDCAQAASEMLDATFPSLPQGS